ncbi:amidohydrolase family protein [Mesorhizobium sp. DCY119]|uniref:metal-dependent hydrolase family protein n=1 Tax=Mesorhizobium sp. DCY119 TaxID=2108445 RepID=UPI000E6C8593|nr:amidohydrolase family protein [Mesorhizobium sp. DCY119]RJG46085.1 amidohydrolase family protein [Mesorhizobium sp. DCY119]
MMDQVRLKAGLVLAGPDLQSIRNGAILIEAGRIAAVGEDGAVPCPPGCEQRDLGGATLMPGMIDAHMHTFGVDSTQLHLLATEREPYRAARALSELKRMLHAGFTSARCLGSTIGPDVRRAIDDGFAEGPRLKVAGGFISSTSGTWDSRYVSLSVARSSGEVADGPAGLVQAVRQRVREGADFIKLGLSKGGVHDRYHAWGDDPLNQVATFSLEEVRAAVEEAHRNQLYVSAHAIGEGSVRLAVEGGVDIIEHGYGITPQTRALLVEQKKIVVTTISQLHFHRAAYDAYRYPQWERDAYERHWAIMQRDFKLGLEAGVRFALGTDLIGAPTHPLHEAAMEFQLAVEWGMSEHQALHAGTMTGAEALGIASQMGSIEVGKAADIIAVQGNPLLDIATLGKPLLVVKEGRTIRAA